MCVKCLRTEIGRQAITAHAQAQSHALNIASDGALAEDLGRARKLVDDAAQNRRKICESIRAGKIELEPYNHVWMRGELQSTNGKQAGHYAGFFSHILRSTHVWHQKIVPPATIDACYDGKCTCHICHPDDDCVWCNGEGHLEKAISLHTIRQWMANRVERYDVDGEVDFGKLAQDAADHFAYYGGDGATPTDKIMDLAEEVCDQYLEN